MDFPHDTTVQHAAPVAKIPGGSFAPPKFSTSLQGFSLVPLAIMFVTFLAYVDTLILGFVFDDHVLIVTNGAIRSWRYFPTYFTSHIWAFHYPHMLANYYRPLFLTWLRLNDMLFGLHPWGWHLTSVLAHIAVTYLVYRLTMRLTQDGWVAAVAAMLFGLHPVHVEAVADITSIQEPLSTFFILAALLAFARSRESLALSGGGVCDRRLHKGWMAVSLICTAAALLTKESGMITPLLVFCWVWIYGESDGEARAIANHPLTVNRILAALGASIPFWLVVFAYVPARIRALKGFAHVITPLPLSTIIYSIPSVLTFYLRLLLWPVGLSCYYDTPYIQTPDGRAFVLPAAMLALAAVVCVVAYRRLRHTAPEVAKTFAFVCLWMLLTIIPVLNFRFLPEGEIAHDRYIYLPSVGFFILVGLALRKGAQWAARRFGKANRAEGWTIHQRVGDSAREDETPGSELAELPAPAWPAGILLAALFVFLGFATARQNLFWADDFALNFRAHTIAPANIYATTSLGAAVAEKGMPGTAMELYRQALAVDPKFWRANVNLAYLEYVQGNYAEAAHYYAIACTSDPTDGNQFLYLGMSLLHLGRLTEAEQAVRSALLVRPNGNDYHLGLAMVLHGEGRLAEARQEISTELEVDPQNAQARSLLEQVTREIDAAGNISAQGK